MFDEQPPGSIRIKICGICNVADAQVAVECGADAIGLNTFVGSKRFVDLLRAQRWVEELPANVRKIAIMVDPPFDEVVRVAALPFIDGVQLHGSESPEFCRRVADAGISFAKALPVRDEGSLLCLTSYSTRWVVLDSARDGVFGGSGKTFPWELARDFVVAHPQLRVVLAGGLTPENVRDAVQLVRPFGVDVTSGVEAVPARKDHARLRAFISAARSAI